ncbi:hypothetical protein NGB36_19715 [Streptomyces sp. RB6PN25]|uniref:DUF2470 domain-containing protein n=1 Tax=Streptomyces humicola TaxID=2953240 RepID=A0ABT1PYL7_9ACTN|nr:DUF2470 domain-containing protein [Streptomyces humicola]MCQ4082770.1 hypothetical protein [Streptomyces humicola]
MPSAAERVRTLVEGNSSAVLAIPGLYGHEYGAAAPGLIPDERVVDDGGDLLLRFTPDSPAVRAATRPGPVAWGTPEADDVAAVLELSDVAPVAVPHRIRGRAWVAGWLTPAHPRGRPEWLRLEVGEASVDDLWGAEQLGPEEFAAAAPDPLARQEAELLQHLAACHEEHLGWLGALAGACDGGRRCAAGRRPVPLALDRFGLRLRFTGREGAFDARFDFPRPVGDVGGLRQAMLSLFDAAREAAEEQPGA